MSTFVALLYSVVLGPERRLKSAELLALAEAADLAAARTVASSGNLVFESRDTARSLEIRLERAVAERFGRLIPVFVRGAADWVALVAGNPFPEADPATTALRVLRAPMPPEVFARIGARKSAEERLALAERALWVTAPGLLSASPMVRAAGAVWAGEGTFRNASAATRIAAALD